MFEETVDYQLIPSAEAEQAWWVRILTGDYVEVVVAYGKVIMDGEEGNIKFTFDIVYTPDDSLTKDDVDFQKAVSGVLESIIQDSIKRKTVLFSDAETGENVEY